MKTKFNEFLILEFTNKTLNLLKDKFKKEVDGLTDSQIEYYVNSFEKYKDSYKIKEKDITKYSFKELEYIIDENFPRKVEKSEIEKDLTEEAIYNKDGLIIYEGDTKEKCIKYGYGYKWCISRNDTSNMFNMYKYEKRELNFYFIFDSNRKDEFSAIVLLVDKNDKFYMANKNNSGDFTGSKEYSWDDVVSIQPKLKKLKYIFKSKPLTEKEKETYNLIKGSVDDVDLFKYFKNYELVDKYISYGHELKDKQFENLPKDLQYKYFGLMHQTLSNYKFDCLSDSLKNKYIKKCINDDYDVTSFIFNYMSPESKNEYIDVKLMKKRPYVNDDVFKYMSDEQRVALVNNTIKKKYFGLSSKQILLLSDNLKKKLLEEIFYSIKN